MKIYFAGSIRDGRDDKDLYLKLIEHLKNYGKVLTEHVGNPKLTSFGEDGPTENWIFNRDMKWLKETDVVMAEVSTPSLGVGYEIARAEIMKKKILCLYRTQPNKRLSAMLTGNKKLTVITYVDVGDAERKIDKFFRNM